MLFAMKYFWSISNQYCSTLTAALVILKILALLNSYSFSKETKKQQWQHIILLYGPRVHHISFNQNNRCNQDSLNYFFQFFLFLHCITQVPHNKLLQSLLLFLCLSRSIWINSKYFIIIVAIYSAHVFIYICQTAIVRCLLYCSSFSSLENQAFSLINLALIMEKVL